jgi:hypothetical protein
LGPDRSLGTTTTHACLTFFAFEKSQQRRASLRCVRWCRADKDSVSISGCRSVLARSDL